MGCDPTATRAVHRMFRREIAGLPALVGPVADRDTSGARVVAERVGLVLDWLQRHLAVEAAGVWPILRAAADVDWRTVERAEAQHERIVEVCGGVEPLLARWRVRAFASDRAEVVEHLLRLHAVVEDHLDDADADLLPAIAATLRPGQLTQAHRAVLSGLPARERSAFVGLVLGGAEPRERAAFRRCLPALTRARQRLVGHRGNLRSTAPRRHAVTALPDERNY